jgi:hypothetical protein
MLHGVEHPVRRRLLLHEGMHVARCVLREIARQATPHLVGMVLRQNIIVETLPRQPPAAARHFERSAMLVAGPAAETLRALSVAEHHPPVRMGRIGAVERGTAVIVKNRSILRRGYIQITARTGFLDTARDLFLSRAILHSQGRVGMREILPRSQVVDLLFEVRKTRLLFALHVAGPLLELVGPECLHSILFGALAGYSLHLPSRLHARLDRGEPRIHARILLE